MEIKLLIKQIFDVAIKYPKLSLATGLFVSVILNVVLFLKSENHNIILDMVSPHSCMTPLKKVEDAENEFLKDSTKFDTYVRELDRFYKLHKNNLSKK